MFIENPLWVLAAGIAIALMIAAVGLTVVMVRRSDRSPEWEQLHHATFNLMAAQTDMFGRMVAVIERREAGQGFVWDATEIDDRLVKIILKRPRQRTTEDHDFVLEFLALDSYQRCVAAGVVTTQHLAAYANGSSTPAEVAAQINQIIAEATNVPNDLSALSDTLYREALQP